MAKGQQSQQGRTKRTDPSPVAKKSVAKTKSDTSVKCVKCDGCDSVIAEATRALNCEKCGTVWKCASCIGMRTSTYDDLVSDAGRELHWYCEPCFAVINNPLCDDKVNEILSQLATQLSIIDKKLDAKPDAAKVEALEKVVAELEVKLCDGYNGVVKSVEKTKTDVAAVLEKSKWDATTVQGCVEGAIREQTREEKEEEEDKIRRQCNVIIHGLPEPTATEADDRRNEDLNLVEQMLHVMNCDQVSVNHITRLGTPKEDPSSKPRPVKLSMLSSDARLKVLRNSKNLRVSNDATWKTVFMHQDLTPRERENRRRLVQQLKDRKSAGETNLIIINGKIVTRREHSY